MTAILKVISESATQALQQLLNNKLRSFLTLLGITIGIFCIIAVKSSINSLEDNIRGSLEQLGNDVVYIDKMPWDEDPGMSYWKYMRRPEISYDDYKAVAEKVSSAQLVTFSVFSIGKTLKFQKNAVQNAVMIAVTDQYDRIFNLQFEKGRFFSSLEYHTGARQVVLGNVVAEQLFGTLDPIGRTIKMDGIPIQVIGVLKKSGKNLLDPINFDDCFVLSYTFAKYGIGIQIDNNTSLNAKAASGVSLAQLQDDVIGTLRAERRIRPTEENNFAVNELSMISGLLNNVFGVMNLAGFIIGIFALIVGMFSVANIMFVSVKERTNIIGIKKALGAQRFFILLEFLIESIILCIIGGIIGLLLVYAVVTIVSNLLDFKIYLSFNNIMWGVLTSILVGILSGVIPALQAAKMDPVEAIRA